MKTLSVNRKRLAEIRAKLLLFSSEVDTSSWEATFFLNVIETKNAEIRLLRATLANLRRRVRAMHSTAL